MLTDEELSRLLAAAAESYVVPAEGATKVLEQRGEVKESRPRLRRRGLQLTAVAAAVVVAAVLAQNAGSVGVLSSDTKAVYGSSPGSAEGAVGGGTTGGTTGGTGGEDGGTLTDSGVDVSAPFEVLPQVAAVPEADAVTAPSPPDVGSIGDSVGDPARVVKTGSLSLVVDDGNVPATVTKVTGVAQAAKGYVSKSTSQEFGDSPSATLTMRVPVDRFDAVIGQVRALKAEVVSQQSSGADVTASYADTEAQIASLTAARARFLTILAGAKTIGETLTVQQRVDEVQGRIDRLEGQRRVLEQQSDLATLTVTVGERADAELTTQERDGLGKAWDDAKDGFTSGVEALIARSGRALLVLVVGVLAFFVLRIGWRLARRRLV